MSKYKVKSLVAIEGPIKWVWGFGDINVGYSWNKAGKQLCVHQHGCFDMVSTANTLEQAQSIVDAHHAEQVRALIESLIEFTDEPSQQVAGDKQNDKATSI